MSTGLRAILIFAATAALLPASVTIRGTVVENQSGHPLARAAVMVEAVGGHEKPFTTRTSSLGAFEFHALPAGSYIVSAARLAFAQVLYGQKRWHTAGMPITLADNDAASVSIRLPRYGAIAGAILDENEVGLPEHDVAVYTNTRPPRLLARARTDDRGVYRVWGLAPGAYLVRTLAKQYEDGGYLPTFYRDSATLEQSHTVVTVLDDEVDRVDIHPTPGRLFTLTGRLGGSPSSQPAITLSADTGAEHGTIDSVGNFSFIPAAPGNYELLAQGTDHGRTVAAYQAVSLDRDMGEYRLSLTSLPTLQVLLEDTQGQAVDPRQVKLMLRRKDLSGETKPELLQATGKLSLLPGRWEVAVAPNDTYCAVAFVPPQPDSRDHGRPDGWNEILLAAGSQNVVKFVLSSSPATLSGAVRNAAGGVLADAPVYLMPVEPLPEIRTVHTDAKGLYQFKGLAPGLYRVLASLEFQTPDAAELESAQPTTVKVEEAGKTKLDLDEFVIK